MPPRTPSRRAPAAPLAQGEDHLVTGHRWAWYGMSFFIPWLGVFIGLFLYDRDSREVRQVGRNALLISFAIWVIFPLLLLAGLLLVGAVTLLQLFSQAFSGNN
ncbi:MAG TPA: hypothetical protein VMU88_02835 [bacterium]|nr:hypothetical protein [bacterium]